MSWDKHRAPYVGLIKEITASIDEQLRLWAETGDENHKLFADHQIKHLIDIKEHILKLEERDASF